MNCASTRLRAPWLLLPWIASARKPRTARAGAEGVAVSFCAGDERGLLKQIECLTNLRIAVEPFCPRRAWCG